MPFTESERAYLAGQILGRLATVRPDGSLQNNPVGFFVNEQSGTIDIGGYRMGATRKFHNVRANGQVVIPIGAHVVSEHFSPIEGSLNLSHILEGVSNRWERSESSLERPTQTIRHADS